MAPRAAQIPNAPSMWTQAPRSWAIGMSVSNGSNAPVFTLPAWAHTMTGPSMVASSARSASASHPALVVGGDLRTRSPSRPIPSIWSEA